MISKNQLKSETTVETVYTILCGSLEEYSFPPEAMAGAIIGSLIGFGFLITTIICIRKVPALKFHIRCRILYVAYIQRTTLFVLSRNSKRNEHNYAMAIRNEASEPLQKPAIKESSCTMETCESGEKKDNAHNI